MTSTAQAPSYKTPNKPLKVLFGERIYSLRTQRGLTQMQVADNDYTGLDRSYISDLERGVKEPGLSTIHLFAQAFKISMCDLLEGIDK